MKRGVLALAALGLVALAIGWNALFLGPQARQRSDVHEQLASAQSQEDSLRATLAQLDRLSSGTSREDLARLDRLIPAEPDLDGFILTMNDVAAKSQVEWSSLVPAPPVPGPGGGPAVIGITIQVKGTFFQILDYLKRLETLERLVVIDAVDVASAGEGGATPQLAVNLRGRTFAATAGTTVPGGTPVPPAPTLAAPAGGH
jgi:Tfp pilus assembly protein PilO